MRALVFLAMPYHFKSLANSLLHLFSPLFFQALLLIRVEQGEEVRLFYPLTMVKIAILQPMPRSSAKGSRLVWARPGGVSWSPNSGAKSVAKLQYAETWRNQTKTSWLKRSKVELVGMVTKKWQKKKKDGKKKLQEKRERKRLNKTCREKSKMKRKGELLLLWRRWMGSNTNHKIVIIGWLVALGRNECQRGAEVMN